MQSWPLPLTVLLQCLELAGAYYTKDYFCVPFRCVNPVFPGIRVLGQDFLAQQENRSWQCVDDGRADLYLGFCKNVINYKYSLPVGLNSEVELSQRVREEDDKALNAYYQHLSGLKLDAWDFKDPAMGRCSESIWRMVCYEHFPKCNELEENKYLRPCVSSCVDYLSACNVRCCDESVSCVWDKEITHANGDVGMEKGFVNNQAPSVMCTGPGRDQMTGFFASSSRPGLLVVAAILFGRRDLSVLAVALMSMLGLQGCGGAGGEFISGSVDFFMENGPIKVDTRGVDSAIGIHNIGAWRKEQDFTVTDAFVKADGKMIFNSCSDPTADTLTVCSGRGHCEPWDPNDVAHPVSFCKCEDSYAGPECRTKRKSQVVTFVLSVFGGMFGLDMFYLGFNVVGAIKLLTFGGLGWWWLTDLVRIGVGSVYTNGQYRTMSDLPFWAFAVSVVCLALSLGFAIFLGLVLKPHVIAKRRAAALPAAPTFDVEQSAGSSGNRPNAHLEKVQHLLHLSKA
jgi:TM2 domain-containing membrane protein YozV